MQKLLFFSAIAVLPMYANADPCPRGYEVVEVQGPWTSCRPITDPQRCEMILSEQACDNGMGFVIGSHLAACERRISVLNDRCKVNKVVWKCQAEVQLACMPTLLLPSNSSACEKARQALRRAAERSHEVYEETERRLKWPISGGGRGIHVLL